MLNLQKITDIWHESKGLPDLGGLVNLRELAKAVKTGLWSGGIVGVGIAVLMSVMASSSLIFPNATIAGLVTLILAAGLDTLRRIARGQPSTIILSPAVPPETIAGKPLSTPAVLRETHSDDRSDSIRPATQAKGMFTSPEPREVHYDCGIDLTKIDKLPTSADLAKQFGGLDPLDTNYRQFPPID